MTRAPERRFASSARTTLVCSALQKKRAARGSRASMMSPTRTIRSASMPGRGIQTARARTGPFVTEMDVGEEESADFDKIVWGGRSSWGQGS